MADGRDEIAQGKRKPPPPETLPDGTVRYFLVLGPKGRVLLPADLRQAMGLQEGDVITAWLKDGEVRMHSHLHGLRKIQVEASSMAKGDGLCVGRADRASVAPRPPRMTRTARRWLRDRKQKR